MTSRSDNHIKRFFNIFKLITTVFAVLIIASCPMAMDDDLLAEVEDVVAPTIIITTPGAVADDNLYINSITIEGRVVDYSNEDGSVTGQIQSFIYYDEDEQLFSGTVNFGSDGSFTIIQPIVNPNHPALFGGLTVILDAVDWNGNSNDPLPYVRFYPFGDPIITNLTVNDIAAGNNIYSSNDQGLKSLVEVKGNATGFANSIIYSVNHNGTVDSYGLLDLDFHDPNNGDFIFTINPAVDGWSGNMVITITSETASGGTDTKTIDLYDHPIHLGVDSTTISGDNNTVMVVYNDGVYHNGIDPPLIADFTYNFIPGAGSNTNVTGISFVGTPAAGALSIQFNIARTGDDPNGLEELEILPSGTAGFILADWYGNPVTESGSDFFQDKKGPTVIDVYADNGEGAYNDDGNTIHVKVKFDEVVNVDTTFGTPEIALNSNADAVAIYDGTDGTEILTFNYSVSDGDNSLLLDYDDANFSLDFKGATIKDTTSPVANDADPTLPAVGGVSSLAQSNITIDTDHPTAPVVTSAAPVTNLDPVWSWTPGGGGNDNYRISDDDTAWATGETSPYTETGLTDAIHTLFVQERDAAGNWSPSGQFDIKLDTVGPNIIINDTPGTNGVPYTFIDVSVTDPDLASTDAGSGDSGTYLWTQTNGGIGTEVSFNDDTILLTKVSVLGYEDGTYELTLSAEDNAGNPSTSTVDITWDDGPVLTDVIFKDTGTNTGPGIGIGDTITFIFDEELEPTSVHPDLDFVGGSTNKTITDTALSDLIACVGAFASGNSGTALADLTMVEPDLDTIIITLNEAESTSVPSGDFNANEANNDITDMSSPANPVHNSDAVTPVGTFDLTASISASPTPVNLALLSPIAVVTVTVTYSEPIDLSGFSEGSNLTYSYSNPTIASIAPLPGIWSDFNKIYTKQYNIIRTGGGTGTGTFTVTAKDTEDLYGNIQNTPVNVSITVNVLN